MQNFTPFIALLSGIVVAVITYLFTVNKEHIFLMRQKYEALFIAVSKYDLSIDHRADIISRMIMGQMDFDEADEYRTKHPVNNHAFDEANMFINIYFQDLVQEWSGIVKIRNEILDFNMRIFRIKQFEEDIDDMKEELRKQGDIHDRFRESIEKFKETILATAREKSAIDALKPSLFVNLNERARINRSRSLDG